MADWFDENSPPQATQPQPDWFAQNAPKPVEERSIPSKIGHAVLDTVKGFLPQSVEDAALAPVTMFPGVGQAYKSLSNIAFGRPASEGISPVAGIPVVQRIPEIIQAEKTPALSQERFTTGAGVVADLAMIAGFKAAPEMAAKPKLAEVAGIAKPEVTTPIEPVATDTAAATPIVPEVAPSVPAAESVVTTPLSPETTSLGKVEPVAPDLPTGTGGAKLVVGNVQERLAKAPETLDTDTLQQAVAGTRKTLSDVQESKARGVNTKPIEDGLNELISDYQKIIDQRNEATKTKPDVVSTVPSGQTGIESKTIPEGLVEEGINQEHPDVAAEIDRYSHNQESRGLTNALKHEDYEGYHLDLQRLLKRVYGDEPIPVTRVEGYEEGAHGKGVGEHISVSTFPKWGEGAAKRGAKVIKGFVNREDVVAAGNEAEGELIIKKSGLKPSPVPEAPVSTTATPLTQTETSISGNKTPVAQTTAVGTGEAIQYPQQAWDSIRNSAEYVRKGNDSHLVTVSPSLKNPDYSRINYWDNRGIVSHLELPTEKVEAELQKNALPRGGVIVSVEGGIGGTLPSADYAGMGFYPTATGTKGVKAFVGPKESVDWMQSRLESGGYKVSIKPVTENVPEKAGQDFFATKAQREAPSVSVEGQAPTAPLSTETTTGEPTNAIQEPSTGEVLQRQPEETGTTGGQRVGVEQGVQREKPAETLQTATPQEQVIPEGAKANVTVRDANGEPVQLQNVDAKQWETKFTERKSAYEKLMECLG